jgi:methionyl-tRNA formyltransferase
MSWYRGTARMKCVVVIGNGKMALDCLKILMDKAVEVPLVVHAPIEESARLARFCERQGIPTLPIRDPGEREVVERVQEFEPDIIFNINSFSILREPLLSLPPEGIMNFHNGPLPRYRGLNIPSWVIINGESVHGVTWHFVEAAVDAGDIVTQRMFPLEGSETALGLTFKCILEGTDLFHEVAEAVIRGVVPRRPQGDGGSYYSQRDVPYGGRVPFDLPFVELERLVRGLDFRPYPNPFVYPKTAYGGRDFVVARVVKQSIGTPDVRPGTVLSVKGPGIMVAGQDATFEIIEVLDDQGEEISCAALASRYGLVAGSVLGK